MSADKPLSLLINHEIYSKINITMTLTKTTGVEQFLAHIVSIAMISKKNVYTRIFLYQNYILMPLLENNQKIVHKDTGGKEFNLFEGWPSISDFFSINKFISRKTPSHAQLISED